MEFNGTNATTNPTMRSKATIRGQWAQPRIQVINGMAPMPNATIRGAQQRRYNATNEANDAILLEPDVQPIHA
jgi:hypothetical protein